MSRTVVLRCFVGTAAMMEDFIAENNIPSSNIHTILYIGLSPGLEPRYSMWYSAYLE